MPTKKHRMGEEKTMNVSVVGLNYRMTSTTQEQLQEHTPMLVELVREPENNHDENAIAVHLTRWRKDMMIGYLPRDVAAKLAPLLDHGDVEITSVWLKDVVPGGFGELLISFRRKIS